MMRLLVLAVVVAIGVLPSSMASAVSVSISPSSIDRSVDDFSVAVYDVFLNADGFTDGIDFADVTLAISGVELLDLASFANSVGNPFLPIGSGRLKINAPDPGGCLSPCAHFGGIVFGGLVPTPTGTEVFQLGELHLVHVGTPGTVTFTLDGPFSQFGTPGHGPSLHYTNEGAIVATLTVLEAEPGIGAATPVPEPAIGVLLLMPLAAGGGIQARRSWSRKASPSR